MEECKQGEINKGEKVEDEQDTESMDGEMVKNNEQRKILEGKEVSCRKSPLSLVESVRQLQHQHRPNLSKFSSQ